MASLVMQVSEFTRVIVRTLHKSIRVIVHFPNYFAWFHYFTLCLQKSSPSRRHSCTTHVALQQTKFPHPLMKVTHSMVHVERGLASIILLCRLLCRNKAITFIPMCQSKFHGWLCGWCVSSRCINFCVGIVRWHYLALLESKGCMFRTLSLEKLFTVDSKHSSPAPTSLPSTANSPPPPQQVVVVVNFVQWKLRLSK